MSIQFDSGVILTCLKEIKDIEFQTDIITNLPYLILVNGAVQEQCQSADDLERVMAHLYQYRRCGIIDHHVSILKRREHLFIRTDGGRLLRPLFLVENLHRHLRTSIRKISTQSFTDLLNCGIIEYIDSDEEDTKEVASSFSLITPTSDLVEIHPSLILSLNTNYATIYSSHNQGPRITYQLAMSKQSMSEIQPDFQESMQSRTHSLLYGQRSLACTLVSQVKGFPMSSGLNCVVLIATYEGFNQEDSIIMSKSFIERGGFRMLDSKTYTYAGSEIVSNLSAKASFRRYDGAAYNKLDDDGLPSPRTTLEEKDVILAKHTEDECEEKLDTSSLAKDKKGTISRVIFGHGLRRKKSSLNEESVKVNITSYETRQPIVGDKFASIHAQKGTVARIVAEEDLPFSSISGIRPDIILNPAGTYNKTVSFPALNHC